VEVGEKVFFPNKGVDYKIKIKGLKVGAIGVAKVFAVGTV